MEGSCVTLLAGALHRDLGAREAKLLVETGDARSACSENPSHPTIIAHCRLQQRSTDALSPVLLGDPIVQASPTMRGNLDQMRHLLEQFNEELGVTDPVSGEAILDITAQR